MHTRLADQLNMCLEIGEVPEWMTKGRTLLFVKDTCSGNNASNNRPITCLPLMWKLLTGMISEDVYWFLNEMDLLPEVQKGARKGSRGTHDLLFIDKMILQSARNGKMNLFMAWIDYRKAYDMLPHSWIKECLDWFGVASNVKNLLFKSMEQWRTELHSMSTPIGKSRSIEVS